MSGISLRSFSGPVPKQSADRLGPDQAQRADNIKLFSRELRAWKRPYKVAASTKAGTALSMYRMNNGGSDYWMSWIADVDVARGPVADTGQRFYYTGDGSPKKTNFALATTGVGTEYPLGHYEMGVPAPTVPTVAVGAAGAGTTAVRSYVLTFKTAWGEEGPPSTVSATASFGTTGFTVNLSALDVGTRAVAITRAGSVATVVQAAHGYRNGSKVTISGATQPDYNGTFVITYVDANTYTYTVPGAPATPATGSPVAIGNYNLGTKCIYRSLTGSTGITAYQLVVELPLSTTTYADSILDGALGVVLPSTGWIEPPEGLTGLCEMDNGMLTGFVGNTVYFSEPFQPHAWPLKYALTLPVNIVGMAASEQAAIAATDGWPYIFSGSHPASMQQTKVTFPGNPCVAKRSVAMGPPGAFYASPNGLVLVTGSVAAVVSGDFYTKKEWGEQIVPALIKAAIFEGRYFAFTTVGGMSKGIMFDRSDAETTLMTFSLNCDEIWADDKTGKAYLLDDNDIEEWDGDPYNNLPFDWIGRLYIEPKPLNYGAAQVIADYDALTAVDPAFVALQAIDLAFNVAIFAEASIWTGNQRLSNTRGPLHQARMQIYRLNGSRLRTVGAQSYDSRYLQFRVYVDNVLRFTKNLTSMEAFSLPAGVKSDRWSFGLSGNINVSAMKVAVTHQALQRL